jgi:putative ABC transport system permease protein
VSHAFGLNVGQASFAAAEIGWPVAVASLTLVGGALALSGWFRLRIERELIEASIRAAVQLLAVGVLFTSIFRSSQALVWAWAWVVVMVAVATVVVVRRAKYHIDGLRLAAGLAVATAAVVSIAVTFGFGVVDYEPVSLVVIAGITIGNAVPSAALGANQAVSLCRDRVGDLEALLALGLDRRHIIRFMGPRAAAASLLPQVERTKVVGLIALPGAMTGLLLAGVDPFEAVMVQLLVMYLVLGTAAVCVVATVTAITRSAITSNLVVAEWVRSEPPDGRINTGRR